MKTKHEKKKEWGWNHKKQIYKPSKKNNQKNGVQIWEMKN
jgi:hypothetical protein